jgi:anti-anti-sigma factor
VTAVVEFAICVADLPGHEPTISLRGTLDESGAATLETAVQEVLEKAPGCDVTFDCAALTALDYTGLGVVVLASNQLRANGHAVHLRDVHPRVMDVIHRCGVRRMLDARPSQPEA